MMETYQDLEKEKDDIAFFKFVEDQLILAKQEAINRQWEKKYNDLIRKQLEENVRIPMPPFFSLEWFVEKGYALEGDGWLKNGFLVSNLVSVHRDGYLSAYGLTVHENVGGDKRIRFTGQVNTEEDFEALERMLDI